MAPSRTSSARSADKVRQPRFVVADDSSGDESGREAHQPSPPPPAIVIDGGASRKDEIRSSSNHVGFVEPPLQEKQPDHGAAAANAADMQDGGERQRADPEKSSPSDFSADSSYPPTGRQAFDRPEFDTEPPLEANAHAKKSRLPPLPEFLAWIPPHLNWKGWRPVIRSSLAAWLGLLLSKCTIVCSPHTRRLT